eukprot:8685343-Pyramimonas_sp.AAC.1
MSYTCTRHRRKPNHPHDTHTTEHIRVEFAGRGRRGTLSTPEGGAQGEVPERGPHTRECRTA